MTSCDPCLCYSVMGVPVSVRSMTRKNSATQVAKQQQLIVDIMICM